MTAIMELEHAKNVLKEHKEHSEAEHKALDVRLAKIDAEIAQLQIASKKSSVFKSLINYHISNLQKKRNQVEAEEGPMHKKHEEVKANDLKQIHEATLAVQRESFMMPRAMPVCNALPITDASLTMRMAGALPTVSEGKEQANHSMIAGTALSTLAFAMVMYRHVKVIQVTTDALVNAVSGFGNTLYSMFQNQAAIAMAKNESKLSAESTNRPKI